jgi:Caspase domain
VKGAIADAKAVKDYLEKKLGVPESHIQTLFDEAATHDGIIQKLRDLQSTDAKEGDPILIYYGGYAVTGDAPVGWDVSHGKIALLAPYDIHCREDKTLVNAIPDYTIGILLEDLARAKGDNIVRLVCATVRSYAHPNNTDGRTRLQSLGFVLR